MVKKKTKHTGSGGYREDRMSHSTRKFRHIDLRTPRNNGPNKGRGVSTFKTFLSTLPPPSVYTLLQDYLLPSKQQASWHFAVEILGNMVQWTTSSWHSFQISLQYEYSLPVHPPPLPSQPSLQPHQPGLKPFLQPTDATGVQVTPQKPGPQPPMHPGQLPLQEGELTAADEQPQVLPSENPPTPEVILWLWHQISITH